MRIQFIVLVLALLFSFTSEAFIKLATYNIRNFDYDERDDIHTNKSKLKDIIAKASPELMAVQEINNTSEFKYFLRKNFQQYSVVFTKCGGSHGQKLGFVYNHYKLNLQKFHEDMRVSNPNNPNQTSCAGSRPLGIAQFKILGTQTQFIAIAVHLKAGGQDRSIQKRFKQLDILKSVIRDIRRDGFENFVVMGDFNSTEYIFKSHHHDRFMQIIESAGLIDLTKDVGCTSYWWGGVEDGKEYPSILDHILVSKALYYQRPHETAKPMAHCKKVSCREVPTDLLGVTYGQVSDHCPIVANLR